MRFNQYSYINFPKENVLSELKNVALIYKIQPITKTHLKPFTSFLFTYQDTNYPLSILAADKKQTC